MSDNTQVQDYYYYDPAYVPIKFGMQNTGAICWFNSLLQMMLGLPALNRTLLECESELKSNPFATEYIKVLKASGVGGSEGSQSSLSHKNPLNSASLLPASAAILGALLIRTRQKGIRMNMGVGQECADEGFITFIEMLDCPQVERLFSNVYELIIECKGCKKKVSSIRDKSVRIQMFTQVPLETKEKFCTYLRIHPSEHDYFKCDCGHLMTKFYRAEKLKMLREIVVIMFNKFITKDVRWFPQELIFKGRDNRDLNYRLVGKIEHSGTRLSGHYWAHSFRDGEWVCLNDSGVSAGNSAPSANTFMVCYHLVRPDANPSDS